VELVAELVELVVVGPVATQYAAQVRRLPALAELADRVNLE
jgi:hypothetical protein